MANRTDGALAKVIYNAATNVLQIVPHNSEGKVVLDAAFADMGGLTTVAAVQADAVMGGYGDTSQPYKLLQLTFS